MLKREKGRLALRDMCTMQGSTRMALAWVEAPQGRGGAWRACSLRWTNLHMRACTSVHVWRAMRHAARPMGCMGELCCARCPEHLSTQKHAWCCGCGHTRASCSRDFLLVASPSCASYLWTPSGVGAGLVRGPLQDAAGAVLVEAAWGCATVRDQRCRKWGAVMRGREGGPGGGGAGSEQ